jgi:predicted SAM-dependent methyltransferase
LDWTDILAKDLIYLNLGGGSRCHPVTAYENYISVDIDPPNLGWAVKHDLRDPIPLPDSCVHRIHCEDFLEHLKFDEIKVLLIECFRLLIPTGMMRIGVPDYNNPKDRRCLKNGNDPRFPAHVTLTNYELMKNVVEQSPFHRYKFHQYWDGDKFNHGRIDYSLGMIRRTPDNDPRCRRSGLLHTTLGAFSDILYKLIRAYNFSEQDYLARKGHRYYVTSLVVDLFND